MHIPICTLGEVPVLCLDFFKINGSNKIVYYNNLKTKGNKAYFL